MPNMVTAGALGSAIRLSFQGRPDGDRQLGLAGLVTLVVLLIHFGLLVPRKVLTGQQRDTEHGRAGLRECRPHPSGAVGAGQVSDLLELDRTPNAAITTLLPLRRDGVQR